MPSAVLDKISKTTNPADDVVWRWVRESRYRPTPENRPLTMIFTAPSVEITDIGMAWKPNIQITEIQIRKSHGLAGEPRTVLLGILVRKGHPETGDASLADCGGPDFADRSCPAHSVTVSPT